MKFKSFVVTFTTFALTSILFYIIGHMFTIPWLMFHHEYSNHVNGFYITTGSLTPLIIGLVFSFFAEKIYIYQYQKKLG